VLVLQGWQLLVLLAVCCQESNTTGVVCSLCLLQGGRATLTIAAYVFDAWL